MKSKSLLPITERQLQEAEKQLLLEQQDIKYDSKDYTVEILVHKYTKEDQELYIPEYQRDFVWDEKRKCKFIESVLLGIPIPVLFGADMETSGNIEIIDGVQRLRTLTAFLSDELVLENLEKLDCLDDFRFSNLSRAQQNRFKNRTIRLVTLYEKVNLNTRLEVFERINTTPLPLLPSEIRRGAYAGPFYNLIDECAQDELFVNLCPMSPRRRKRREGEELVLRFFAYADRYRKFQHDVSKFLDQYLQDMNGKVADHPRDIESHKSKLMSVLNFVDTNLPTGFKKSQHSKQTPRVRFEAISVGTHLALQRDPDLKNPPLDWLDSAEFEQHVRSDASNSRPKVRGRIEFVRDKLLGGD